MQVARRARQQEGFRRLVGSVYRNKEGEPVGYSLNGHQRPTYWVDSEELSVDENDNEEQLILEVKGVVGVAEVVGVAAD
jgi:hypothetical protein